MSLDDNTFKKKQNMVEKTSQLNQIDPNMTNNSSNKKNSISNSNSNNNNKNLNGSTIKNKNDSDSNNNKEHDLEHLNKSSNSNNNNLANGAVLPNKLPDYFEIDYNDLEIYEKCGRGSYGMVYRGFWKSRNKQVAIKKLLQLENEAEILSSCSHRNIIQFYGVVTKANNYCIITEYAEYGSLHSFIGTHDLYDEYGFELILNWAHDIALGMNYLHSEAPIKIIHRDLKSNNVLITGEDMTCKICDFGSSRFGIQTTKMTITGTFPWMSPEIIQSKPANQSCDIWSFGVVLWELITGEVPFKGIEEFQIAFLVVEKDYRLPIPNGCPPVFSSLMQMCWQTDPKLRPTFKQILSTLDGIEMDDLAKEEIDNLFTKNKANWELEIEQAFERLKKIEDDLQIKEKLLEAKERRLREIEMEYITQTSKLVHLEDHDVNTWREIDVYEWIKKIGLKNNRDGIGDYCEKFLNHNINGKRLLLMSKADLRNIGITSEGHIIDLHHEIETLKLENTRLLNFPPLKQRTTSKSQLMIKTVSFNVLIGTHVIQSSRPEVRIVCQLYGENFFFNIENLKDIKWKIYADFDEYEDSKEINIVSCISDVKFVCRNHFEQFTITKAPFIMRNWIKGIQSEEIRINCVITYCNKVIQPRKTTFEFKLNINNLSETVIQRVQLTLEDVDISCLKTATTITTNNTSNASSCTSSATNSAAINIISANLRFQSSPSTSSPLTNVANSIVSSNPVGSFSYADCLTNANNQITKSENVWKKRNLENSVIIPQETQVKNSSDLWAGIVAGKYRNSQEDMITNNRKFSNGEIVLPNKPPAGCLNRSLTTNDVVNTNTVKMRTNGQSYLSSRESFTSPNNTIKIKNNENSNDSSGAINRHVYKRNLSGFGRGKFLTHNQNNLNNSSVGKIDNINFTREDHNPKAQANNNSEKRNPFFY